MEPLYLISMALMIALRTFVSSLSKAEALNRSGLESGVEYVVSCY